MNANETNERRGTLAVLALIFGIAAIVISWAPFVNVLSFLLAIAAMVLGAIEIKRIDRGSSSPKGKGFAITGIILGVAAVAIGIAMSFVWSLLIGGVWGYLDLLF